MRKFLLALVPLVALGTAEAAVVDSAPAKQQLTYTVQHSKYGTIGTYTNTIERQGDTTHVATEAKLGVSMLGISFYSQNISRKETWRGNRIVDFKGVTTTNGKSIELTGKADGDHFTMMTPNGATTAPADVRIANPWSKAAVEGAVMLTPDRGRVENITTDEKGMTTLKIGNRDVRTEHIQVMRGSPDRRYEVWLDEKGTPVQFALVGNDTITFTLKS